MDFVPLEPVITAITLNCTEKCGEPMGAPGPVRR